MDTKKSHSKEIIQTLREKLNQYVHLRENRTFSLINSGLPVGALVEFSGSFGGGKTEVALKFLAENPELKVAWVEAVLSVYPFAFPQQGVSLARVLFLETSRYLWAVQQLLRSQIFGVVVLGLSTHETEANLRRFQIDAEKAHATLILLTPSPTTQGNWPISVQYQVSRCSRTRVPLLKPMKNRGRKWNLNPACSVTL